MAVEGDRFLDAKPFQDHEAQGIAQRIGLVRVLADKGYRAILVRLPDALDSVGVGLNQVQEAERGNKAEERATGAGREPGSRLVPLTRKRACELQRSERCRTSSVSIPERSCSTVNCSRIRSGCVICMVNLRG